MDKQVAKREGRVRRHRRVRKKVTGSAARPRLAVYRANTNIYAQVIDDATGRTLVAASSLDGEARKASGGDGKVAAAKAVGGLVAKRAIAAKITDVVFDRGGNLYHGRVKALAEGAREAGLNL
jgi:large subunit ribosomal protein L18